jgi:WD40 repeat protein
MKIVVRLMISSGLLLVVWTGMDAAPAPEVARLRQKARLKGCPFRFVTDLAFSPDSKLLAVAGGDKGGVPLWDVVSRKVAVVLPVLDCIYVRFSPDGKRVATAGRDIKVWDVASGKELASFKRKIPRGELASLREMLFSADGKRIAAIGKDNVTILSVEKKEEARRYDLDSSPRLVFSYSALKEPVFALSRGKGKPIALMDPFTGKEVRSCENELELLLNNLVSDREEKMLAGVCRDRRDWRHERWEVSLWDRHSGKKIAAMSPDLLAGFVTFTLSPDGKMLVVFAREGPPLRPVPLEGKGRPFTGLRFYDAPSGRSLGFQQWSGLGVFPDLQGSHTLVFSPDGHLLATAGGGNVTLWSIPEAWRKKK